MKHLQKKTKARLKTTPESGSSNKNRVGLHNSCLALVHSTREEERDEIVLTTA